MSDFSEAYRVFGNSAMLYEMQEKILREFLPEYQRRLALKGHNVRIDVESVGETTNVKVCHPNGIPIREFAFFVDKFNSINWMPVYNVRGR
ncbi:MAG: hypothetical protein ACRCWQ_10935 [Bacilli bacterium]